MPAIPNRYTATTIRMLAAVCVLLLWCFGASIASAQPAGSGAGANQQAGNSPWVVRDTVVTSKTFTEDEFIVKEKDLSHLTVDALIGNPWDALTSQTAIGGALAVYNAVAMIFAAALFIYVTLYAVLKTSEQGKFMESWSNAVVPLRFVTGVGMMFPVASGFSIAQVLVLLVVYLGIGSANLVVNGAMDGFSRGIGVGISNADISKNNLIPALKTSALGTHCMARTNITAGAQEIMPSPRAGTQGYPRSTKIGSETITAQYGYFNKDGHYEMTWGGSQSGSTTRGASACGSVIIERPQSDKSAWDQVRLGAGQTIQSMLGLFGVDDSPVQATDRNLLSLVTGMISGYAAGLQEGSATATITDSYTAQMFQARIRAYENALKTMTPRVILQSVDSTQVADWKGTGDLGALPSGTPTKIDEANAFKLTSSMTLGSAMADGINAYRMTLGSAFATAKNQSGQFKEATNERLMKARSAISGSSTDTDVKQGWMYLGFYMLDLSRLSRPLEEANYLQVQVNPPSSTLVNSAGGTGITQMDYTAAESTDFAKQIDKAIEVDPRAAKEAFAALSMTSNSMTTNQRANALAGTDYSEASRTPALDHVVSFARYMLFDPSIASHPLLQFSSNGASVTNAAVVVLGLGKALDAISGKGNSPSDSGDNTPSEAGKDADSSNKLFAKLLSLGGAVASFVTALCWVLLALGLIMAIVFPLIPALYWIGGLVGWVITLFVALFAMPIFMAAHLFPHGSDVAGKASAGYPLIIELIARPVLMVLGFFAAYVAAAPLLTISSTLIIQSLYAIAGTGLFIYAASLGVLMLTYVVVCWIVLVRVFGLISVIPQSVFNYVGSQGGQNDSQSNFMFMVSRAGGMGTNLAAASTRGLVSLGRMGR